LAKEVASVRVRKFKVVGEMDRILKGIMRYRETVRTGMVQEFARVRDHPEVLK